MNNKEKRKNNRIEVDALLDYLGEEVLLYHQIKDLSMGGLSISTPTLEEVGSTVVITINFPDLNDSITTKVKVAWITKKPKKTMGLTFISLTEDEKALLKRYLNKKAKS